MKAAGSVPEQEVVTMTESTKHSIVVGVDGSEASKAALRWGVNQARRYGSTVTAMQIWQYPVMAFDGYGGGAVAMMTAEDYEKVTEQSLATTVADVVGDDLSVPIVMSVCNGHAASKLVDAGDAADLLVVGSEGHGGFSGMLLGSVSMHVVHHAKCPVVVVRPGWTPPAQ